MRSSRFIIVTAVLVLLLPSVYAQVTADLTGSVTSEGKPLPGVTVTISAPTMQGTRTTLTGENGGYQFSGLTPGDYTVTFELSGLQTVTKRARVQLSQTARADADLKIASVSEAITVTAGTPTVLETPQVATTFTSKQIEALPVPRTPIAAALLAPGVNNNTLSGNQFSISGSPGYDNLVLVNGVVVTENVRSQVQNLYIEDAIQETTVLSGAISAEYGRFTGGVVNSITKSGGNEFSGSFRDSLSNPAWTALTPYPGQVKPDSKIDKVTEETLGGYALKDRLWFFGAGRQANRGINRATTGISSTTNPFRNLTALDYINGTDQKRYEVKLTGQITPKHSLVGSYLKVTERESNNAFTPIYDTASLVQRELPNALYSYHYNGMFTTNTLLEAQYSRRTYAFVNSGSTFRDLVGGTLLLDRSNNNTRFNSPTFCGVCATETRDNGEYIVKGNYYLNTRRVGNHNFVAGVDNFKEKRFAENHQSGSDYRVFVTTAFFDASRNIYPQFNSSSTFIRWTPIFLSGGNDKITTQSGFVNDKIDFNPHWSFNLGLRYDKNDAKDANGTVASKDSAISPRLTAMFDPFANGRHRLTLSYNQYASRIVEGVATQNQSAGSPGSIDYLYSGPLINPDTNPTQTPMPQAIAQAFAWFASQCGGMVNGTIDASKCPASLLRPGGNRSVPGFFANFDQRLKSPSVGELALGYGAQIGRAGYAKIDLISRKWKDFYGQETLQSSTKVTTPIGIPVDLATVVNTNDIKRTYRAVQMQGQWNPQRMQLGVNYTWSKLRGNDEGENAGSGPILNLPLDVYYPEYAGYSQRLPVGYLTADQRHRLRAWAGYDFLTGNYGNLNASVLESYDSGRPYPTFFTADLLRYTGAPSLSTYVGGGPATGNYYLCRDCNRTEGATHTDLAVNYSLPIWRTQLFVRATVTNLFNEHALVGYDTGRPDATGTLNVGSQVNAAGNQFANFQPFNPFTQTPVACPSNLSGTACKSGGFNYQKASNFGQATAFTAYQPARTYAGSVGVRF